MLGIINSILQDIENSIVFTKLGIMHPSIINPTGLFNELQKLQLKITKEQFPLELTLKNLPLFEKLLNVESYILNNKLTYLIRIPVTYSQIFEHYRLYSAPVF